MSSKARRGGLARGSAELVKNVARRTGLLPAGTPDRLSDDEKLLDGRFEATVMVYFPDTRVNLYQLRQWYAPLLALNDRHPVVVVLQDSRAARLVRQELALPAVVIGHYERLDELLSRSEVKLALYVNHNPQNFAAMRFTSLAHVYLTHGDSDKGVSVSNQSKAYDFIFVPGQAAVDRMQAYTMFYDAAPHCVLIGCPQLDVDQPTVGAPPSAGRPTVLYAPTWEGAQPSMAYGSVGSHGPGIIRALLGDGRFAVAYRPHPLSGIASAEYGDADAEVRRLVTEAATQDPGAGHRVETDRPVSDSLAGADLLVTDISAMAIEWLPSGKPIVITEPASSAVVTARTRMLDVVPRLLVSDLPGLGALVADQLGRDPTRAARSELIDYYLGDTSPGAATRNFLDACTRVIAARDESWAAVTARGPAGP
jgi:CDP-Glycerol:Poly(glycerophosphate) glycerophosphotransferase